MFLFGLIFLCPEVMLATAARSAAGAASYAPALPSALFQSAGLIPLADLPPAGPAIELTRPQVAWLHVNLVQTREPVFSPIVFDALVQRDGKALAQILPLINQSPRNIEAILATFYQGLRQVVDSDLPAMERAQLAQAFNARLAESTLALSQAGTLGVKQRRTLAQVHDRYLNNRGALNELLHHRQVTQLLKQVHREAGAEVPARRPESPADDGSWIIDSPVPMADRGREADEERSAPVIFGTSEIARDLSEMKFRLDKHASRYGIALRSPLLSERLRGRLGAELSEFRGRIAESAAGLKSFLTRIAECSLPSSFFNPWVLEARPRRIFFIPNNRNLRLIPEADGYLVKANFETDIQDATVLAFVKSSIEEYWNGRFDWQGRSVGLRVVVDIKKIPPGGGFSRGSLQMRDLAGAGGISHAQPGMIALSHRLEYATAAHEFGHILGLNDEYREGYDPEVRAARYFFNPASIMGTATRGKVLERHRRLAFLLLRRRSLAVPQE